MLNFISVVSIPVSDQDRALAFYRDFLGFNLIMDTNIQEGMRWVFLGLPDSHTRITLVTWFPTMPPGSLKGMVVDTNDVDAEAARFRSMNWPISELFDAPWGRYFTLDDPDGNGLIIQKSAETIG